MSEGANAALTREIAETGRGLVRLARYDPRWPDGFDLTTTGFFRSFFGPLLALPFYLVLAALAASEGGAKPFTGQILWIAGIGHVFNAVAFPALVAAFARPFGFTSGYAAFIILVNWAALFINVALCLCAPLTLLGRGGFEAFGFLWMMLFLVSIYLIWRAARETLSTEFTPALLMVVLSVAVGVASDQVGGALVRAAT
jgi:hypothetical protein